LEWSVRRGYEQQAAVGLYQGTLELDSQSYRDVSEREAVDYYDL